MADAVGGLVQLGWDVRDLGCRVLLVGRIPAFGLSLLVGLVRVMRMLLMRVTAVALVLAVLLVLTVLLVLAVVLVLTVLLVLLLRVDGHLRLGLVAQLLVSVRLVALVLVALPAPWGFWLLLLE